MSAENQTFENTNTNESTSTNVAQSETINVLQYHTVPEGRRYAGVVKWFDNKLNFGFVTITHCRDGTTIDNTDSNIGQDIFVHQTNLTTSTDKVFRTLNQLDRVELSLEETEGEHRFQAVSVTGPFGAYLNCELLPRRSSNFGVNNRGRYRGRSQGYSNRRYPQTFQRRGYRGNGNNTSSE